jgi:hypothetical protein
MKNSLNVRYGPKLFEVGIYLNSCNWIRYGTINWSLRDSLVVWAIYLLLAIWVVSLAALKSQFATMSKPHTAHPSTIIEAIGLARFCKALEHFFGVDVTAPVEPEPPPLPSPNLSRTRPCCIPSQSSHCPIAHTAQTYIPMSVVPGKTIQMLSRNSWPYCNSKSILHVYMIGPLMRMPHIV